MKTPINSAWEMGRVRLANVIPIVEVERAIEAYSRQRFKMEILCRYAEYVMSRSAGFFYRDARFFREIHFRISQEEYSVGEIQMRTLVGIMRDVNSDGFQFERFEEKVDNYLPESRQLDFLKDQAEKAVNGAYKEIHDLGKLLNVKIFTQPSASSQPSSFLSFEE